MYLWRLLSVLLDEREVTWVYVRSVKYNVYINIPMNTNVHPSIKKMQDSHLPKLI